MALPLFLVRPTEATGDTSTAAVVPTVVLRPWFWQATVGQWPSGPAAVLFFTNQTRYREDTGVVVGRDGAYRLIPMTVGEQRGLLSPDGRTYVRSGPEQLDLITGDTRRVSGDDWKVRPLAWSPEEDSLLS